MMNSLAKMTNSLPCKNAYYAPYIVLFVYVILLHVDCEDTLTISPDTIFFAFTVYALKKVEEKSDRQVL